MNYWPKIQNSVVFKVLPILVYFQLHWERENGIMGKQGSPRSPRPELSIGTKDYQIRSLESLPSSDPSIGRRYSGVDNNWKTKVVLLEGLKNEYGKLGSKGVYVGKRHIWFRKHVRSIAFMFALMGFLFLLDSFMVSIFDSINVQNDSTSSNSSGLKVWYILLY